jgi:hypothetical protein
VADTQLSLTAVVDTAAAVDMRAVVDTAVVASISS